MDVVRAFSRKIQPANSPQAASFLGVGVAGLGVSVFHSREGCSLPINPSTPA